MEELTNNLINFDYPRNHNRKNVLKEGDKYYYGFVLGKIISWAHCGSNETGHQLRDSRRTHYKKYENIRDLIFEFGKHLDFTTVQVNKNYQCAKHIDGNNVGISTIIGLGDYTGGELLVYYDGHDAQPTKVDIKNKFFEFNGSEYYHETAPFTGERHTLVYYSL
jgi:hypothetical protein